MDDMAHEIYRAKMDALAAGEEAVVQQIGEGKDIMSKLCEYRSDPTHLCDFFGLLMGPFLVRIVQANMAAAEQDKLPDDQLIAQIACETFLLSSSMLPLTFEQNDRICGHGHHLGRSRPYPARACRASRGSGSCTR